MIKALNLRIECFFYVHNGVKHDLKAISKGLGIERSSYSSKVLISIGGVVKSLISFKCVSF